MDADNRQPALTELERTLLNDYQQRLPLQSRPFAGIAEQLGVDEDTVLETLRSLQSRGMISRVGPVFRPNRVGASTLAAMAVPPAQLECVAERVGAHAEVNHNYEREHHFNLWFVVTAESTERVAQVLAEIEQENGLAVMDLPMLDDFHIDLGFELQWN